MSDSGASGLHEEFKKATGKEVMVPATGWNYGYSPRYVWWLEDEVDRLRRLEQVVREVHAREGDDHCWMGVDEIFAAAGLPKPDRNVGDKAAMKANCDAFIDAMCSGGEMPSYADLKAEVARLNDSLNKILNLIFAFGVVASAAFLKDPDASARKFGEAVNLANTILRVVEISKKGKTGGDA